MLGEAASLVQVIEREFRSRSESGDDADVKSFLLRQADTAASEADLLLDLAAGQEGERNSLSNALVALPATNTIAHGIEEQTLNNLVFAFSALSMKQAVFQAASHPQLSQHCQHASEAASTAFHFLSTRSKIAFNMLTPNEIDPSVETRTATGRIA